MIALIKEESGHMTSNIANTRNNITGMKVPKLRETYATNNTGFAIFDSYEDCIEDLAIYFDKYIVSKNLSNKEAARFLEKNYAMSDGYANRLLNLM